MILWQHSLDKPFTGGLGSYTVYVMLAHLLHNLQEAVRMDDAPVNAQINDLGTLLMVKSCLLFIIHLMMFHPRPSSSITETKPTSIRK